MAEALGLIEEQHAWLSDSLLTLKTKALSHLKTLPKDCADSLIAHYFIDLAYDVNEGLYKAVDQAWTQTFQSEYTQVEQEALVLGGQYGWPMIYMYLSYFLKQPQMEAHNRLNVLY
jgi:hypothetical protein